MADGHPDQTTLAVIRDPEVVRVGAPMGRGVQMNAGAAQAEGEIFVFLHADTRLPQGWDVLVRRALSGRAVAGSFSLAIDSPRASLALVAAVANLRTRLERIPYGDQVQFIRAETFRSLGGFAEIPIMEDVELFRRLRAEKQPVAVLAAKATTSARRWEARGVVRQTLTNWWLRLRYEHGCDPVELIRHYGPQSKE